MDEAVISVPAYFQAIRTTHILEAARQAGFQDVTTIAEPTAAALKYGLQVDHEALVLVFDLGAGTLDVTVLQAVQNDDGNLLFGELGISGNAALGGLDMDDAIREFLVDKHKELTPANDRDRAVLREEIEKTKIRLSKAQKARLLFANSEVILTRDELEEVLNPILQRFQGPIQDAISKSGLNASDIDHVLLVGGPTHMPCVRGALRKELALLGVKENVLAEIDAVDQRGFPVDPMECVSQGAALRAAGVVTPSCTSLAEGYGVVIGSDRGHHYDPIIKQNSMYPIEGKVSLIFSNPNAKAISVGLVAKSADTDNYQESKPSFQYEHLGQYTLSVLPTGDLHCVELALKISKDKELKATLTQKGTGNEVTYKKPDMLKGDIVQLLDDEDIPGWNSDTVQAMRATYDRERSAWTKKEVEGCMFMAIRLLELARDYDHRGLQ